MEELDDSEVEVEMLSNHICITHFNRTMKQRFCLQSLVCLLMVSCSINELDTVDSRLSDGEVFLAKLEEYSLPDTKVYVDENVKILWDTDDRISIFNRNTYNQEYRFEGETGDNAGSFKKVPNGNFMAGNPMDFVCSVYPFIESTTISSTGVMDLTLPAEQGYWEGSFGPGANTMVSVTEDNILQFKNIGGYLVLKLFGEGVSVSSIKLEGNNGERLSGGATLALAVGENPAIAMASTAGTSITLTCKTPVKLGAAKEQATQFWMVVPPTVFAKGFKLTVADENGSVFVKETAKNLSIVRNGVLRISPIEVKKSLFVGNVVFSDVNFKDYCVEHFDTNADGFVSYEEARAVKEIDVNTESITSLKGIEYFTNLERLTCEAKYLYCLVIGGWHMYNAGGEEVIGLLTSLDLSKNTKLKYLDCDANQLTNLDLSANSVLTDVSCRYNYLTSLVVGENSSLSQLSCKYNYLTSLDVSGCSALESLDCYSNQLTSLDVSNNVALTYLSCYRNDLRSLDVSNNTSLSYLSCESNPSLLSIWLRKGQKIDSFYYDSSVSTVYYKN